MKKLLLLLVTVGSYCSCASQNWQDTVAMIEKIFDRYKPNNPGCQLAIARNGKILFSRAWGMADLEHSVALTTGSVIEAGSVSKQFTAAAILLLEQQGKLSLNDDIRKYFPELPDYGTPIKLEHMMHHTSGLKDWGSIGGIAGWPRTTKTYNNDDALYIICNQKTLNHKPGAEFLYSNSNYNLFAILVQRVSGMSLAEFSRKYIFEPAGMQHTEWRDNFRKVVPNRAIAYQKSGNEYLTHMPNEYVYGNGGLLTTVEDLVIWTNYYHSGKFGNPSLLQKQLALYPFNNGIMNFYAAGLFVDSVRGWKMISHDGATASYRSNLEYFPALDLIVAWLSNTSEFDQQPSLADSVRNIFVKDVSVSTKDEPLAVQVLADVLNGYIGWYKDPRAAAGIRLFMRDGKLANSRGGNLIPVAPGIFLLGRNRIELTAGKNRKLLFITPVDSILFMGVDSATINDKMLKEYAGEYYSSEAEVKFYVNVKDGKLILQRKPSTHYTLTPTYKDGFTFAGGGIEFGRDRKHKVTKMMVSVSRARNVEFLKL